MGDTEREAGRPALRLVGGEVPAPTEDTCATCEFEDGSFCEECPRCPGPEDPAALMEAYTTIGNRCSELLGLLSSDRFAARRYGSHLWSVQAIIRALERAQEGALNGTAGLLLADAAPERRN